MIYIRLFFLTQALNPRNILKCLSFFMLQFTIMVCTCRFLVDWIPIRTFRNHADKGVAFPQWQPMSAKVSLWNGDSWATRGGKDKVDWSKSPFVASFGNYTIDACVWDGNPRFCRSNATGNWWNGDGFSSLTSIQRRWFKWVRRYHVIYDYCKDIDRFQGSLPKECSLSKYWTELHHFHFPPIYIYTCVFLH